MSYSPEQITNYSEKGLTQLLSQFQGKPAFESLVQSYLNRVQELEYAIWEVIQIRGIDGSSGVGLDVIGNIVDRRRLGLNDVDYRVALKCQILINRSSGTPNDLIKITTLSITTSQLFSYQEAYEATVVITVQGIAAFNIPVLFDNLTRAKAGGVRLLLILSLAPVGNTFTLSPVSGPLGSTTLGFSDYSNPGTGGFLTTVMQG